MRHVRMSSWPSGAVFDRLCSPLPIVLAAMVKASVLAAVVGYLHASEGVVRSAAAAACLAAVVACPLAWVVSRKIRELSLVARQAAELASKDDLTGLLNRREFFLSGNDQISSIMQKKGTCTLLYIDVDRFKEVNDTWGHGIGDRVLKEIGSAISSTIRASDFAARLGGEEFAVMLPDTTIHSASRIADLIRDKAKAISFPDTIKPGMVSVSVGIAELAPQKNLNDLLDDADRCLYVAKSRGRDRTASTLDQALSANFAGSTPDAAAIRVA